MSWVTVGVAVVGAFSSASASSRASQEAQMQRAISVNQLDNQNAIAARQEVRAQQLYDNYQNVYAPREKQLVNQAFNQPLIPDVQARNAITDVGTSLASARASRNRDLRRLGVDPTSGNAIAMNAQLGLAGAKAKAAAATRARAQTSDENFARQSGLLSLGRNLPSDAYNFAQSAQNGLASVSTAMQNNANRADDYAYQAGMNYGASLNKAIYTGLDAWENRKPKTTLPARDPSLRMF